LSMLPVVICIAAYLLGSIPTGYIITKLFKGVDIRTAGSGNPGATNVYRTAGAAAGIATFILDLLKGFLPVIFAVMLLGNGRVLWWVLAGLCAVAGHVWTVFLGFKGGKGVATACGVFFALLPLGTLFALALFLAVVFLTRYVSAGSICGAVFLPVYSWFSGEPRVLCVFATLVGALIVIRHKDNIERIINGTENKFGRQPGGEVKNNG